MKTKVLVGATGVLLLVLSVVLSFYWLWSWAGSLDSHGRRAGLIDQFMQRKTAAAIEIRDALAEADFRRMERGASKLRRIGEATDWHLNDAQYGAHSNDYRDALSSFDSAISGRNLTELQNAYVNLIEGCINCHRHSTRARIDLDSLCLEGAAITSGISDRSISRIATRTRRHASICRDGKDSFQSSLAVLPYSALQYRISLCRLLL